MSTLPQSQRARVPCSISLSKNRFAVNKDKCLYCKKEGYYKKDCLEFLKMIMTKKCENIITFINESLYVQYSKSTWWIDSVATVHVANLFKGFRSTKTT
jgi:hypothetical protein